jgi:hypothetical protein
MALSVKIVCVPDSIGQQLGNSLFKYNVIQDRGTGSCLRTNMTAGHITEYHKLWYIYCFFKGRNNQHIPNMLSHVFPHIILQNEGLVSLTSPSIAPLVPFRLHKRSSSYLSHHAESFLPDSDSSHRSSSYIRHIQSELNLHSLKYKLSKAPVHELRPHPKRARSPNPLRKSFTPNEVRLRPRTRRTMSIASISGVLAQPLTSVYSSSDLALSDGFVQKGRRYSMLPTIITQEAPACPLRAHQFGHWHSLSAPSSPIVDTRDHSLHDIPEVVSLKWPAERFYAKYRRPADASGWEQRRVVQQEHTFNRIINKLHRLFLQKSVV